MESKLEVTNLIAPIIAAYKAISNEFSNLMDIGLSEYLHDQTYKYYFTNTFIHRGEKVVFNSIYYPLKAVYAELTTDFTDLKGLFQDYKNITLVGSAGSGKTTLVKHIFLESLLKNQQIPLIIELRFLNSYAGDFEKLITEKILNTSIKPSPGILQRALKTGKFLFLLDGYDEVYSLKKQEINRQIESFMDAYAKNNFVITTRPGSGIESFPRFFDFKMESLDDDDVIGFLNKIVENPERNNRISEIINNSENKNFIEYLRNPLLLSMFIMAIESHPEIPSKKSSFYRNVFETLYEKHDGFTKNSFPREKKTGLEKEQFEVILNILCYITNVKGEYVFTEQSLTDTLNVIKRKADYKFVASDMIYDLRTTISILIEDGYEYRFPHRSMQEYFCAAFLAALPDEKKAKVYEQLIEAYKTRSNDLSFHFWELCRELDEHNFMSLFLIPELTRIREQIVGKTDKDTLIKYVNLFQHSFFLQIGDKEKTVNIIRNSSFANSLLKYCDISLGGKIYKHWQTAGRNSAAELRIIGKGNPHRLYKIIKEDFDSLFEAGIFSILQRQLLLIDKKIKHLKAQVKKNKTTLDDLLDF